VLVSKSNQFCESINPSGRDEVVSVSSSHETDDLLEELDGID